MSLLNTASTWSNDESPNKKRISTIRKTVKLRPQNTSDFNKESYTTMNSIVKDNQTNENRESKVNELLNKITMNDGEENNKMGEFKPLSPPEINVKQDYSNENEHKPLYIPPPVQFKSSGVASSIHGEPNRNYNANDNDKNVYSNYNRSYNTAQTVPYYAKMGINGGGSGVNDNLTEKMNYMIHLMEQQQYEKTDNVTEEFLLYTFLGIFIIFVADSFARVGKYTR